MVWNRVDLINDNITLINTKSATKWEIPIWSELKDMLLSLGPKPSGKVFEISENAFECTWKRMLKS